MKRVSKRWVNSRLKLTELGLADEPVRIEYRVDWSGIEASSTFIEMARSTFLQGIWYHSEYTDLDCIWELRSHDLILKPSDRSNIVKASPANRKKFFNKRIRLAIRSIVWKELPARLLDKEYIVIDLDRNLYWHWAFNK
jgi:hypothetical protein